MKILFVGDMHVVVEELDECQRLIDLVWATAEKDRVDKVVFLGDQHHNHAVVRVEVMEFWRKVFQHPMVAQGDVFALVGNHDRPGDSSLTSHAMLAYADQVQVVDRSTPIGPGVHAIPYCATHEDFLQKCREARSATPGKTVICHQTFSGSFYENGLFAPDGINPDLVPYEYIISGHIHAPQRFGKVFYPGAPRWRGISDANTQRYLEIWNFDDTGVPIGGKRVPTDSVCKPLETADITPENPDFNPLFQNSRVVLSIYGPHDFVEQMKEKYAARALVRTFPTRPAVASVRESEGIHKALMDFLGRYVGKNGTPSETLLAMAKERIHADSIG
jgi:DNA repair exonuclease SbcCD nuclease subunit